MANVIKKIKIKKQDGTFTDYIPIGAEAENINVDGESVGTKLNKMPYYYNSVADMKNDETLKVGDMAITLGYYEANDGGGAEYKIVDTSTGIVDDGGSYHELDNGLWAELIIKNEINVAQFGAKGNGIIDDTNYIRNAINCGASIINFIKDRVYMVTPFTGDVDNDNNAHGILIPSNTIVDLNESTIQVIANDRKRYQVFSMLDVHNITLKNGKIIGDVDSHLNTTGEWGYGVSIIYSNHIKLENLYITKCWGDGININFVSGHADQFDSDDIYIENCICDDNRRQGMSIEAGNNIFVNNCQFINTGLTKKTNPGAGVDIEPLVANKTLNNISFHNCLFKNNKGMQFVGGGSVASNIIVSNVSFENCTFNSDTSPESWVLWVKDIFYGKIVHSLIESSKTVRLAPANDFIFTNNKVECKKINVITHSCTDSVIYFDSNIILSDETYESTTGFISNYDNTPQLNKNNTIIFTNNTVKGAKEGDTVISPALITIFHDQGLDKIIINNNYIEGGRSAIQTSASAIIKNNIIVGQVRSAISLSTSTDNTYIAHFDIENNNFQNTGSQNYIIYNYNKKNLCLKHNTYYPFYFNQGIGEDNYNKTQWLYTTPLDYIIEGDNEIIVVESSI